MFSFFSNHGVLGLNARNLLYVKPFNPRKAVAFADDKLKTKAFLAARGVPTAKIYARIENRDQLREFDFGQLPNECVLKPNYGFGGEGILILRGRKNGVFLRNGRVPITDEEISEHIEDILDGMFSVNGRRDTAFFEQILTSHTCFARFRPVGLPDIRIIVFNLVPVMAMLRIPTKESEGKANIHLGGIGIGIDMSKGITTHAAQYHGMIAELPHGGSPGGIQIPYWDNILLICSRIQQITNIGYLAVDITIDEHMGPALLEVNARAGLMVQVANLAPLRARLERVKGISVSSPEKGVRIGQDLFGGEKISTVTKEGTSSKPILGTHETIVISGDGTNIEVPCLIAPERERTVFTPKLIESLQGKGALEVEDEKEKTYRVKFTLGNKKLQTLIGVGEVWGEERAMIGRRDLTGFLIDPSKGITSSTSMKASVKADVRALDKMLSQIDRDLLLLKHLKPVNLEEERARLVQDKRYNPMFQYREPEIDLDEAERKLQNRIEDSSGLGILLEKKRQELLIRIELLRSRGDATRFTQQSRALYGAPTSALIHDAEAALRERMACELPTPKKELLTATEVQKIFAKALERYSLHDWQATVRPKLVADCTVGGRHIYIRASALFEETHVEALMAHEIETHILTAENGSHQPYAIFRNGCANYLDTQEGLAIYNQNRIYGPFHEKRFNPPRNLLGLAFGLEHSFAETRRYLKEELGYGEEKALNQAISIKRGLGDTSHPGGFTKSLVYFRGLRAVEQFVRNGGDLTRLYVGKIAMEDLAMVEKVPELQKPLLLPEFLRKKKEDAPKKATPKKEKAKKKSVKKEVEADAEE
ncbi:hypothetical protein COU78_05945 [Candidatus Peregrinibacteria bacterium CG10_big_fil_rev_8_21_14_0_10_49_24]|nr:MAG: hypothetical protein COV83_04650 [Candidatus Peregrinibacteria bacterium CG11_big_fil_rev_8_21_14_0_20_49_14]PIR50563.1 MAG: hypothetical protein COU78_05945 [Candidatus Peregrinibacteria bacterium CG10_big_fil_rev_8_21_14_0_10_49_24]PJA67933.1 MAG: hypothetical protein CO157_02115 [Candidatus Peregrinibacteria bacterium CG_4_9_14_3_um_filter_49_12]